MNEWVLNYTLIKFYVRIESPHMDHFLVQILASAEYDLQPSLAFSTSPNKV